MPLSNLFKRNVPPPVSVDAVMGALAQALDPETNRDLVSLGRVKGVACRDGIVTFTILMPEAGSPLQVPLERRARKAVGAIAGVKDVIVNFENSEGSGLRETTPMALDVKRVIAVASGKGGVGKSTVAANVSTRLAKMGLRVGLLDADIHGPNIPLMMGISSDAPMMFGDKILPQQAHGVSVMSMGLLVPADAPVIWRGPMLHQAIRQLLRDVMWGQLDYLVIDLPPGTGDAQITLTQSLPLSGALLVTTPQEVALADVVKGGMMFRQLDVPLLGLIENMSFYPLPDGSRDYVFGQGGSDRVAARLGIPVIARVPIDSAVRRGGDSGTPIVLLAPESAAAQALRSATDAVIAAIDALPPPVPPPAPPPAFKPDPTLNILRGP